MSANTLPAGLREREALAVRRDRMAALIVDLMCWPHPHRAMGRIGRLLTEYRSLTAQIAALGEVVRGPGDWRRGRVGTPGEGR